MQLIGSKTGATVEADAGFRLRADSFVCDRHREGGFGAAAADYSQLGGGGVSAVRRLISPAARAAGPGRFERGGHESDRRLVWRHALLPWRRRPCRTGD